MLSLKAFLFLLLSIIVPGITLCWAKAEPSLIRVTKLIKHGNYHQKYRLQQHSFLMDAIQLKPKTELLIRSHIGARLNGYVVGFGGVKQLEEEAEKLGLSGKVLDYVKNLVIRYEGQGLTC